MYWYLSRRQSVGVHIPRSRSCYISGTVFSYVGSDCIDLLHRDGKQYIDIIRRTEEMVWNLS